MGGTSLAGRASPDAGRRSVVPVGGALRAGKPEWSGLVSYVRWDWISTSYMMASVVALVACYVFAFGSGKSDVIGNGTIALQSTMTIARIWRG